MYLKKFGFTADPFQSTNAADEPNISKYFVPPPYFDSVVGDPSQPRSQVILAPRGGGKTAQRVMLEQKSLGATDYLCVTYDDFLLKDGVTLDQIDLNYHLRNINELILIAILLNIASRERAGFRLDSVHVSILKESIEIYLGTHSQQLHSAAIGKFKNLGDDVEELWNKYGGKISALVNAALGYLGHQSVDLTTLTKNPENFDQSHSFYLRKLAEIAVALGYTSVYVLVDRVDEIALTSSDAAKSYRFIKPLISDLHILETPNIAFKFFLWDQIRDAYIDNGARPDRIKIYALEWSVAEIKMILAQRLRSFSGGGVTDLSQIIQADVQPGCLVSYVAKGSPRDLIRVCARIVDEQTKTGPQECAITSAKFWQGIENFCNERAEELYGRHLPDIKKIGKLTFTNPMLANDVFRVTENAVRAKIQTWQNVGAVAKIGDVPNKGNRPLYLYGITDLRLAIAALRNVSIEDVFGNYLLLCPRCSALNICDDTKFSCECGSTIKLSDAQSIYEACYNVKVDPADPPHRNADLTPDEHASLTRSFRA